MTVIYIKNYIKNKLRYVKRRIKKVDYSAPDIYQLDIELIKQVRPTDVFFDIGANIGHVSEIILRAYPNLPVFSFEPDPGAFADLSKRFNRSEYKNLHLFQLAICDKSGEAVFSLHPTSQRSSLGSSLEYAGTKKVTVKTVTIDEFCQKNKIVPTVLKIDVEGFEPEVITGMEGLLRKSPPRVIFIELENRHLVERSFDVAGQVERLTKWGYECYFVGDDRLVPYDEKLVPSCAADRPYYWDYLLILK